MSVAPTLREPSLAPAHPAIAERGVAVPFTTPQLAGARIRLSQRGSPEYIVMNPSGKRGVYITTWDGMTQICRPTLHDRALHRRLLGTRDLTPPVMWTFAIEVAAEGLAGPDVAAAAAHASAADALCRDLTQAELLKLLGRHVEMPPAAAGASTSDHAAIAKIAPILGQTPAQVGAALESLGALLAPAGLVGNVASARLQVAAIGLRDLRAGLATVVRVTGAGSDADFVGTSAELTSTLLRAMLAEIRGLLSDIPALLRRWSGGPVAIQAIAERPGWLLDGWDRVVAAWTDHAGSRDATLSEMADLTPAIPREILAWARLDADGVAGAVRNRRSPSRAEGWQSDDAALDTVARNERLRAVILRPPAARSVAA